MSSLNDFDSGNERWCFQMLDLLEPTTTTDSPKKGQRDRIGQVQLFIEVIRRYGAAAQIRHLFQLFELCFLYEMA